MSDSLRPHARLFCRWESPGKNSGVGFHALIQGIFLTQGWNQCLMSPVLAGKFFTTSTTWEAPPDILTNPHSLSSPCIRWPKYFRVEKFFSMILQWWSMTLCSYWNLQTLWASQVAQWLKNPPAMQETQVWYLGQEDPLEEGMETHSSILAWRIPCRKEPGRLQSIGSQRVRHNWSDWACMHRTLQQRMNLKMVILKII